MSALCCDYGIPTCLLRFLGACVYGEAKSYYAGLSEASRMDLEREGERFSMTAWFYRYLSDILPEERRKTYQNVYQRRQVKALMDEQALKRLYRVFVAHNLRFVPIKGADLAYRIYSDAALRNFSDWDIWFHPDDCEHALAVLAEDGWRVPAFSPDDRDAVRMNGAHHFSVRVCGQYHIEPHFTLANFDGVDPYEMWKYTQEYPAGDGQLVLSPEMNLLMLARHAASLSYYHAQIPKLLTDAAISINEKIDYVKLRNLADQWHLPYPGDLLAAFPEFFPVKIIDALAADPKKSGEFRRVFELRGKLGNPQKTSFILCRDEARGKVAEEILKHIRAHNSTMIRRMYHLPERGAWGRVIWSYVCWFWTRGCDASQWVLRKPGLRNYFQAVRNVEEASNSK